MKKYFVMLVLSGVVFTGCASDKPVKSEEVVINTEENEVYQEADRYVYKGFEVREFYGDDYWYVSVLNKDTDKSYYLICVDDEYYFSEVVSVFGENIGVIDGEEAIVTDSKLEVETSGLTYVDFSDSLNISFNDLAVDALKVRALDKNTLLDVYIRDTSDEMSYEDALDKMRDAYWMLVQ